ncbi:DUF411 domain-containing protein [Cohaesibacter intestini]|uniref:DUF411 domain-containing protein n=1 Tax=Cohaesibacter intestini TaxID=2211145 RepID=UPI000DEA5A98|nr:DUF411 domain-containing protein [Cohaesibacter intestini]
MSLKKNLLVSLFVAGGIALTSQVGLAKSNTMTVYKNEFCGCCGGWIATLVQLGYKIESKNIEDLDWAKQKFSVPEDMESCHTAVIDGYVVEGHVHPTALAKMLKERPDIKGIAVPGMPDGALGMEYDANAQYTVYAFGGSLVNKTEPYYEVGKK